MVTSQKDLKIVRFTVFNVSHYVTKIKTLSTKVFDYFISYNGLQDQPPTGVTMKNNKQNLNRFL